MYSLNSWKLAKDKTVKSYKKKKKEKPINAKDSTELYVLDKLNFFFEKIPCRKIKLSLLKQITKLLKLKIPKILAMSVDEFLSFLQSELKNSKLFEEKAHNNISVLLILSEQLLPASKLKNLIDICGEKITMKAPLPEDLTEVKQRKKTTESRGSAKEPTTKIFVYVVFNIDLNLHSKGKTTSYLTYLANKQFKTSLSLQEAFFLALYFPEKVKNYRIFCQASKINDASVPSIYPENNNTHCFGYSNRFLEYPNGIMPLY